MSDLANARDRLFLKAGQGRGILMSEEHVRALARYVREMESVIRLGADAWKACAEMDAKKNAG